MAETTSPDGNPESRGGNVNNPIWLAADIIHDRGFVHSRVEEATYRLCEWDTQSGQILKLYERESDERAKSYFLYVTEPGNTPTKTMYCLSGERKGIYAVQDQTDQEKPGDMHHIYSDELRQQLNITVARYLQTVPPQRTALHMWLGVPGPATRVLPKQETAVQTQLILGDLAAAGMLGLIDSRPSIVERRPAIVNKAIARFMRSGAADGHYDEQAVRRVISRYALDCVR
ncbi:MAG: hypothetical protein WBP26_01545 [Candidatus Saccharimonadales bacterium]